MGRNDEQVKIRGFRIELGEIEAQLQKHTAINACIVLVTDVQSTANNKFMDCADKQLVAYYVQTNKNTTIEHDVLRAYLGEQLPEHMIPGIFISLEIFPLTVNGKIDRQELSMRGIDFSRRDKHVAPRNVLEQQLATVWQQVLGVASVSIYDNFFALGGDSIKSIQVISCAKQLSIDITAQAMFKYTNIAELAMHCHADDSLQTVLIKDDAEPFMSETEQAECKTLMAADSNVADIYPASQMQRLMVDAYQQHQQGVYHSQHVYYWTKKHFSLEKFSAVFNKLVEAAPV